MKVSLKWLRDYVPVALPVDELAARLTASGNEVAGVIRTGGDWEQVQVARVLKVQPHPNADRLRLATVDLGGGQKTVVCGAPNLAEGQRVAYAAVGARLRDGHSGQPTELKAARIRGVLSEGMICSERELGLSDEHQGILVLPESAPVGTPLEEVLGDAVLDLDVTPNRSDCYSLVGVAREVAVLTGARVNEPDASYPEAGPPIAGRAAVEVRDSDLCPRYTASLVTGVRIAPSPEWMQERLVAAGMRPINNVVDITNYVMLETGQPLHAFDFATVRGHRIVVRRAQEDEAMTTLDGVARRFSSETLLICDAEGPVGVGGIIGGLDSEVSATTTEVLLEAANFNAINIRQSETALRVMTEASRRFDKGLHPHSAEVGLRRATKLLVELCGGTAAQGIIDVHPTPRPIPTVHVTQHRINTVLGATLSGGAVHDVLSALGCRLTGEWEPGFQVTPPWWRPDLKIQDDFAEEVARILGYDTIPTTAIRGAIPHASPNPLREIKERSRDLLAALGLQEVINYSLTSLARLERLRPLPAVTTTAPIRVANPMSAEQEYLRTTLRASLLANLADNQHHGQGRPLRLFEAGRIYLPRPGDLPEERDQVLAVIAGPAAEPGWDVTVTPSDFYDAKGLMEAWLRGLRVAPSFQPGSDPNLVPGRTAVVLAGGEVVGVVGQVHPAVLERFDIGLPEVYLFEGDLGRLQTHQQAGARFTPLPRFPAVTEDLAVVVEDGVAADAVARAIAGGRWVAAVRLFDVYTGPPVPAGSRSLAFAVSYQAPDHTLTSDEVAAARGAILAALARDFGAQMR